MTSSQFCITYILFQCVITNYFTEVLLFFFTLLTEKTPFFFNLLDMQFLWLRQMVDWLNLSSMRSQFIRLKNKVKCLSETTLSM